MDIFLPDEEIERDTGDYNIYSGGGRDQLLEDDELTPTEVAFMNGYDDAYV